MTQASQPRPRPLLRRDVPAIEKRELVSSDDFASAIAQCWQDSVLAIIDVGKLLLGAKAALDHGEFVPMIENDLPFGRRTAHRLMAIAEHSILSNGTHVSHLPPSWGTVYELTRAPDPILRGWLTDGTIHTEMERKDVLSLLRSLRSSTRKAIASRPGKYQLILADPPWKYDFMGTDSRAIKLSTRRRAIRILLKTQTCCVSLTTIVFSSCGRQAQNWARLCSFLKPGGSSTKLILFG